MRELWAVARHGLIEGMRSRLTALFAGLLLFEIFLVASISQGASLRDQMQTFLSYTVGISSVLLSFLTMGLTCAVLSREVEKRYVFTALTKPVARWKHIVGRWLGMCMLQAGLVALCGISIYGAAHYIRYNAGATDPEAPVNREVMCARVLLAPSDMEERIQEEIQARVARLRSSGEYDARVEAVGQEMMDASVRRFAIDRLESAAPPGAGLNSELSWRFDGLPAPEDTGETLQFRIEVEAGNAMDMEELQRVLKFVNPDTGDGVFMAVRYPVGSPKAVYVPATLISNGGSLEVTFLNQPPPNSASPIQSSVTISLSEVELLYRVGGFAGNFLRAMLLVWVLQAFLAAMAVLFASWLSFAVACLWCVVLYVIGLMSGFVIEAVTETPVPTTMSRIGAWVSEAILWLLPNLSLVDPTDELVGGLLISWPLVLIAAAKFMVVWSGICLLLAALIFTRRELARIIAE